MVFIAVVVIVVKFNVGNHCTIATMVVSEVKTQGERISYMGRALGTVALKI